MSKFLRNVHTLKHTLFAPHGFIRALLLEPSSQICNFSSKAISKGKRKSKSSGRESGDGNLSEKDLALQKALDQTRAIGGNAISFEGKKKSKLSRNESGDENLSKKDLALRKALDQMRAIDRSAASFEGKKKYKSSGNKSGDRNMSKEDLALQKPLDQTRAVDGSAIAFEGKKKSKSSGNVSGDGNMSKKDLSLQVFLDQTRTFDRSATTFEGKNKSKSSKTKSADGNMSKKDLVLRKTLDKMKAIDGSAISFKGKKKSKSSGNNSGDGNMSMKDLALKKALDQISTSFGKDTIMWVSQSGPLKSVPVVSTGSISLDMALGIGGLPKGRIVEIYGPEASGKTTLALHIIAEAQKQGGSCVFIDAERALDPAIAKTYGVNTDNLVLSLRESSEQALSLVDTLIRSGSVDVVVVDSVASLLPKCKFDGEMGDAHMAMQARLTRQALFKLRHSVSLSQTILVFLNQVRTELSTSEGSGDPTKVTCGGNAVTFYASIRLNIRKIGFVKKGEEVVGSKVLVKIVKNKHGPPFRTAQFELEFGKGISRESEIIDLGLQHKFIENAGGAYYSCNGHKFCGKDAVKKFLTENDGIREELVAKLRDKLLDSNTEKEYETEMEVA